MRRSTSETSRPRTSARTNWCSTSQPSFCRRFPALWIAWSPFTRRYKQRRRRAMIKWFLRRWIDKFERTWSYDASYLRDVLDADPRALLAFSKVTGIGTYHKDVPLAVYCAAGIVG